MNDLTTAGTFSLTPQTFEQALTFAQYLADSDLVPKDYRGKPGNCLIAIQWGSEIGLKPLQALQNIAPINGRPTLWGDAMLALVRASPLCEYVTETETATTATCTVKRRGEKEQSRTFSDADAKLAGLLGKSGPWTTSPRRMKQMRARAFALRDVFTDVLRGIQMAEEVMDLPPVTEIVSEVVPECPPELMAAAEAAAGQGRDSFAAWYKDAANGGQTTKAQRALLAPHLPDLQKRTTEADAAKKAAAGAERKAGVVLPTEVAEAEAPPPATDDLDEFRAGLDADPAA